MSSPARVGTTWNLIVRNVVVNDTVVTGDTDDTVVTYALTHRGAPFGSGSLTWDAPHREDAWSTQFFLPSTPGVLVAEVTVTVDTSVGTLRASLQVVN
jgi:hypothetical protein